VDDVGHKDSQCLTGVQMSPSRRSCRCIKDIDADAFQTSLRQSVLFVDPATTADGFVQQINNLVTDRLDAFALFHAASVEAGHKMAFTGSTRDEALP
jgi:hypothetical protein